MSPPAPEKRNVAAPNVPCLLFSPLTPSLFELWADVLVIIVRPDFLPLTQPPPGTELPEKTREVGGPKTKVFEPLTIRGVEFKVGRNFRCLPSLARSLTDVLRLEKNRIWASPMCMYSSDDGHATDWHLVVRESELPQGPDVSWH